MAAPEVEVSPDGLSSTYRYGGSDNRPSPEAFVDHALKRMAGELDPEGAAANLIERWAEADSTIMEQLPEIRRAMEARSTALAKKRERANRSANKSAGPKVGDIAFIATAMGPTFYLVRKVHVDVAGKVFALTLSDPRTGSTGQAVAIKRIDGVFGNAITRG